MKELLPRSLVLAFGNALGSIVYDAFLKSERVFEMPKYIFMFVFSFVVIFAVLSAFASAKSKESTKD